MRTPEKVRIEALGNRVGGIARPPDSPAVFVRNALPGETVTIRVTAEKKSYIEADLVSVLEPSPWRTEPFCPHYGRCGGCSLQHLDYRRELFWKREWVIKALRNMEHPGVEPAVPSPQSHRCRNRVTFDVLDGKLHLHAFRGDPVQVNECPLMNRRTAEAFESAAAMEIPRETTRLSVRGTVNTDCSSIETFSPGERKWKRVFGGSMTEKLCGFSFPVPPGGFFQVNSSAAEQLLETVLEMAPEDLTTVLDLYGGVGTFGIPLAARGHLVESVEMNRAASACCRQAGEMNGIPADRLRVTAARDRSFLSGSLSGEKRFDLVITDPPRAGMGIRISRQIRRLSPKRIVYVSCNPFSAVRDLRILLQGGYVLSRIVPVDMFPRTDHVETVFLLEGSKG